MDVGMGSVRVFRVQSMLTLLRVLKKIPLLTWISVVHFFPVCQLPTQSVWPLSIGLESTENFTSSIVQNNRFALFNYPLLVIQALTQLGLLGDNMGQNHIKSRNCVVPQFARPAERSDMTKIRPPKQRLFMCKEKDERNYRKSRHRQDFFVVMFVIFPLLSVWSRLCMQTAQTPSLLLSPEHICPVSRQYNCEK